MLAAGAAASQRVMAGRKVDDRSRKTEYGNFPLLYVILVRFLEFVVASRIFRCRMYPSIEPGRVSGSLAVSTFDGGDFIHHRERIELVCSCHHWAFASYTM